MSIAVSVLGDFSGRFFRRYLEEPAYGSWAHADALPPSRLAGGCGPLVPHKGIENRSSIIAVGIPHFDPAWRILESSIALGYHDVTQTGSPL